MVWSTGGLTRFDPKTEKFTHIEEGAERLRYCARPGRHCLVRRAARRDGRIGKVDPKTLKVTKYQAADGDRASRAAIQVDPQGVVWVSPNSRPAKIGPVRSEGRAVQGVSRCQGPARHALRASTLDRDGKGLVLVRVDGRDRPP